jgi:hypothetical protein
MMITAVKGAGRTGVWAEGRCLLGWVENGRLTLITFLWVSLRGTGTP